MRRILLLLVLFLAGLGGNGGAQPFAPFAAMGTPHEIAPADALGPAALLRSGSPALSPIWQYGAGPAPRIPPRRGDATAIGYSLPFLLASLDAAFEARSAHHRQYAAALARARAGLLSSPNTAPPPFPLI